MQNYPPRDENGWVFIVLMVPDRDDPRTSHEILTTIPPEQYDHIMDSRSYLDGDHLH